MVNPFGWPMFRGFGYQFQGNVIPASPEDHGSFQAKKVMNGTEPNDFRRGFHTKKLWIQQKKIRGVYLVVQVLQVTFVILKPMGFERISSLWPWHLHTSTTYMLRLELCIFSGSMAINWFIAFH